MEPKYVCAASPEAKDTVARGNHRKVEKAFGLERLVRRGVPPTGLEPVSRA